jgi:hypothetical protein
MVVPVLRNLGILVPWFSRKAFLRQRSKEKPPLGGRSIVVFVISSALSSITDGDNDDDDDEYEKRRRRKRTRTRTRTTTTTTRRRDSTLSGAREAPPACPELD